MMLLTRSWHFRGTTLNKICARTERTQPKGEVEDFWYTQKKV